MALTNPTLWTLQRYETTEAFQAAQDQRRALFDKVADPYDWKAFIEARILPEEFDDVAAAVQWFTGSVLTKMDRPDREGRLWVFAEGYYEAEARAERDARDGVHVPRYVA